MANPHLEAYNEKLKLYRLHRDLIERWSSYILTERQKGTGREQILAVLERNHIPPDIAALVFDAALGDYIGYTKKREHLWKLIPGVLKILTGLFFLFLYVNGGSNAWLGPLLIFTGILWLGSCANGMRRGF